MNRSVGSYARSVSRIYENLDNQINDFSRATDLKCPDGCGACCKNPNVEATVLELFPLAQEIYLQERLDEVLEVLNPRLNQGYTPCVLYQPDLKIMGNGRCGFYTHRPLICRLFGFAARKNKYDKIEFSPCRVIKKKEPHLLPRTQMAITNRLLPPLYQESALRVAAILPSLGFRRSPINQAIYEALGHFQWRKPVKPRGRKAA